MITRYFDRGEVDRYVGAVREQLEAGKLDDHVAAAASALGGANDPKAAVLATLPPDQAASESSGGDAGSPFFSRNPVVSLLQTSLEDESRKAGVVEQRDGPSLLSHVFGVVERFLHPEKFGSDDPEWVTRVAAATLARLAKGNHPFNPRPAECVVASPDARVVIVGDWGTGLPRARAVAGWMAEEVADALAHDRPVHVIHLGDVYYSGDPVEIERRVLADGCWPVTVAQAAAGVGSWSLNGNHDMYGGGWGYYDTLLADPRFVRQRSPDGTPTSFFRIRTPDWDLVGLDTAWTTDVQSLGKTAVLEDPQAAVLAGWVDASDRRLMLLSHHQLVTSYDHGDIGVVLPQKLGSLIAAGKIAAWLWGHEHRCMAFAPQDGIAVMRCIGHGGVPIPARDPRAPIPPPGTWQESGSYTDPSGSWQRFGFAVLDLDGPRIEIRYRDDGGAQTRVEHVG